MTIRRVAGWCLVVSMSLAFFAAGVAKFRSPAWETMFLTWGYPAWVRVGVGTLEIACAILLLVPLSRWWAALVLTVTMGGAAVTHLMNGESTRIVVNVALAGLLIVVMRLARNRPRSLAEAE